MTYDEIMQSYEVVDGLIRSPGKFEGNPIYAPYFWDATMDGCAEELSSMEDGEYVALVEISDEDREMFSEIEPDDKYALCCETDQGFVFVSLIDEAEANRIRHRYEG